MIYFSAERIMENKANPTNQTTQITNPSAAPQPFEEVPVQQQNGSPPTTPTVPPFTKNINGMKLFIILGIVVFLLIVSGIVVWSKYRSISISISQQTPSGQEIKFEEVQIGNNASGSTTQTICYFTELTPPIKKVIRTQKEYGAYLSEAESRGYDAFAQNRDNDKFGTYIKYKSIATFESYKNYCKNQYNFPQFDFSKSTLLGQYTPAGGCSADFNKKVLRDDKNKTVNYTVNVNSNGSCLMAISSYNWIMVPSIPNDYTVNFVILTGGKTPPTPKPTPNLATAAVPTTQAAIDVMNANKAVRLWKSYMDELTEPQPSLRTHESSPENIQDKWFVSIQGIKGDTGDWFAVVWIDPYSGKIEVLDFIGSLQRLSQEQRDAINAVNDLPDSYE